MTLKQNNADKSYNVNSILKSKVSSTFSELNKTEKSYLNYLGGFTSKQTQKVYEYQFNKFVEWANYQSYDSIITKSPKALQQDVKDYIVNLKAKGIRHGTLRTIVASVKLFLEQNELELNYNSIRKTVGKETKQLGGRKAYSLEQVQQLFYSMRSIRTKALITTMASSGMRKGAIPSLRVRHLKRQQDGGALVIVYEGDVEEYVAGLTPEAVFFIDSMLDERRNAGLEVNDDSYLFTANTLGNKDHTNNPMTENSVARLLVHAMKQSKIQRTKTGNRFEISLAHGNRKFFKTQCHKVKYTINDKSVQAIETVIIERLMGHSQTSVKMTYLDCDEKELYHEYQKAIPALTISKEWRLMAQNEKLVEESVKPQTESNEKIEKLTSIIADLQEQIKELKKPAFVKDMNGELEEGQPSLVSQLMKELSGIQQAQQKQESVSPQAN